MEEDGDEEEEDIDKRLPILEADSPVPSSTPNRIKLGPSQCA
jgi:hypothetical protein